MPEVVSVSSAILPCPYPKNRGTTAGEPIGFTGENDPAANRVMPATNALNPSCLAGFQAALPLLGGIPRYYSPHPARDFLAPLVFAWALRGRSPIAQELKSITTEEKAGPDPSEAGIEHEGIKRCSQSSRPAAGNTASFRMMCSR